MSTIEKLSKNQVKLTIEVSKEDFKKAITDAYPKATKDVKVDGFRPGKIPMNVFIARFGYAPLYEEAVNEVISKTYPAAVREHNLEVVDYPNIDLDFAKIDHESGFTYTATVYVMPAAELVKYTGLDIEAKSARVLKKDVEAEIKKQLENHVEYVVKEDASENGDTVVIDFEGFVDGKAFEGGKAENYELVLGSGSFVPGFEDQLIGLKEGAEVDVNVTFPKNYHAELAEKDATFKVKVHEVKQKVEPALDDEFVKELDIKGVETVEQYQKHVSDELKENKKKEAEEDYLQKLFEALVKNNPIDLPQAMIDRYAEQLKQNYVNQAKQYNIPFEMFLQFQGLDEKKFEERMKLQAENNIKLDLIIEAVMNKEDFQVTDKEIEEEFKKIADGNKIKVEDAKAQIKAEDVKFHLQREKAIAFLRENNVKKAKKEAKKEE